MAVIGWGILAFILWFLLRNGEAWFFFKEGFKRGGAVFENVDPSGVIEFVHVDGGRDESVMMGGRGLYVFLPRFVRSYLLSENATPEQIQTVEEAKHQYNELLKKRVYLKGIRKPIIHGSRAAAISAPASLIDAMEKARIIEADVYEGWKKAFGSLKQRAQEGIRVHVEVVTLWNIDTLLEFVRHSYSEHDIKAVEEDYYSKGWAAGGKVAAMKQKGDWGWIIWPLILGGLAVIFWWLNDSGMLKRIMGGG